MENKLTHKLKLNQSGVSAVIVAITLFSLIGIAALAIDISHLLLAKNQLQNGADAGALSGAQNLYSSDGTLNPAVFAQARDTAILNIADTSAVEVTLPDDVQRGHWSFLSQTFTPATEPLTWTPLSASYSSFADLDADTSIINAVRCTTHRESTPAASFFAQIFGYSGFNLNNRGVAYIASTPPLTFDVPIAICRQKIQNSDGTFSCNVGRMINSGNIAGTGQSGGWTTFDQTECKAANASDMNSVLSSIKICGGSGITKGLNLGQGIGTVNGEQANVYKNLFDCWNSSSSDSANKANKIESWTLPVVECDQNGRVTGTCSLVVGAVKVDVLWMTDNTAKIADAPTKIEDQQGNMVWSCPAACTTTSTGKNGKTTTSTNGQCCWDGNGNTSLDSFVKHFGLSGEASTFNQKTIYFKPDCAAVSTDGTLFAPFKLSALVN